MDFRDWFFRQFPEYHQVNDSYKDINGEGLLQRYLRGFGVELDEEFIPYIDSFIDIIDLEKCDDKFLPLIAYLLGSPPNMDGTYATYRKLLLYAIALYKVKGTIQAYNIIANILGMSITIQEAIPAKKITYDDDSNPHYDEGFIYDSTCDNCSDYTIVYTGAVPQETLDAFDKIRPFIEPINAHFAGFVPA
jgi:hypothetical protein